MLLQNLIGKVSAPRWAQLTISSDDGLVVLHYISKREGDDPDIIREARYGGHLVPPHAIGDLIKWLGEADGVQVGVPVPVLQALLGQVAAPRWAQLTLASKDGVIDSYFVAKEENQADFTRSARYSGTLLPVAALRDIGEWCKQAYATFTGPNQGTTP